MSGRTWKSNRRRSSSDEHVDDCPLITSDRSKPARTPNIVTLKCNVCCAKNTLIRPPTISLRKRFELSKLLNERNDLTQRQLYKMDNQTIRDTLDLSSGSTALDRCYVGGRGFSRFLKQQMSVDTSDFLAATTASAGPYSSDLIGSYNAENSRLNGAQDDRGSVTERPGDRRGKNNKERDGTLSELRPSSRKNKQLSIIANGKGNNLEKEQRERESIKDCNRLKDDAILPPTGSKSGANYSNSFRPMNSRNNFLGGQAITPQLPAHPGQGRSAQLSSNTTSSSHSRESDDLVATGTNPLQPPGAITNGMSGNGRRSIGSQHGVSANGVQSTQSSGALNGGPGNGIGPSSSTRKMISGKMMGLSTGRNTRELSEPKYSDPLPGAPPTFQQRIAEINSLEQETIRYERAKKFKKKSKSET